MCGAANQQTQNSLGAGDNLEPEPVNSRKPTATNPIPTQRKSQRKPGSSWVYVVVPRLPLTREKNFSEYQDHFKPWPVIADCRPKPVDCIHLKGKIDLLTNYADVYKGVKGPVAKLTRHRVTVGTEPCPFNTFSEYQDTYKAWSVLPPRSHKPAEYKAQGDVEFVTNYTREYKAWKIQKRLPIIQLEQTAMPVGPFEKITSYRQDFTHKTTVKHRPGWSRPNGGQIQLLAKRPQLSRSIAVKEGRENRNTDQQRRRRPVDTVNARRDSPPIKLGRSEQD